eukprot:4957919-Amphidinium_carterae.1
MANLSLCTVCSLPPLSCTSGAANFGFHWLTQTCAEGDSSLPSFRLGKCCDAPRSVRSGQPLDMSPPNGTFQSTFPGLRSLCMKPALFKAPRVLAKAQALRKTQSMFYKSDYEPLHQLYQMRRL